MLSNGVDPWDVAACKQFANTVRERVRESNEARHIILHLLFPQLFEPIASESYKRAIAQAFPDAAGKSGDLDDWLYNIPKSGF